MNKCLSRFVLLPFLLLALATPTVAAPVRNVSPDQARALLEQTPGVFLLDVRTPGEYDDLRIPGARLVPIDQLLGRLGELPRDRPILVYCAVGARSSQVANYLAGRGYPEVYNMSGGVMGWQVRGYPLLRGRP